MMEKIIWEADLECAACSGTGLYRGFAEIEGAAVECHSCDGTGKMHVRHTYTPFTERKNKDNVTRVYRTAGGYGITDKDLTTDDGKVIHFSEAGCTYKEWKAGVEPKPIYDLHCPLLHYQQGTIVGEWMKENRCKKESFLEMNIHACSVKNRESCWTWIANQKLPKEK
jgi:hypothetical protein